MLELGRVSRSGFYRFDAQAAPEADADMDLRDAIQRIAVEMPSYGRRRITAELRRRGWRVNPKRVYRLMREDNLLCVRRRKFVDAVKVNPQDGAAVAMVTRMDALFLVDRHAPMLASVAGCFTFHLIRLFKLYLGMSPAKYVVEQRLRRSRELLREPGSVLPKFPTRATSRCFRNRIV